MWDRPDILVVDFSSNISRGIEQHVQWAMAANSAEPESTVLQFAWYDIA